MLLPEFVQYSSLYSCAIAVKLSFHTLSQRPCGESIQQYWYDRCLEKKNCFILFDRFDFQKSEGLSMAGFNAVYNKNIIDRWTKDCILPFSKKGDLGIAKNYRGIRPTLIAAKIYNALLLNHIKPEIEKILGKNQNGFWGNRSMTSQILSIRQIFECVRAKKKKYMSIISIIELLMWLFVFENKNKPTINRCLPNQKNLSH